MAMVKDQWMPSVYEKGKVDPSFKDAGIDIGALFASLRRNWLLIFGGALVMAAIAWAICLQITPDYKAETRILIEARESIHTRPNGENVAERLVLDPEGVKSQVEVLTSSDVLKRVSSQLRLLDDKAFSSTVTKPWNRFLIMLGMLPDPASLSVEDRVLSRMRKNLQVYNVEVSRVLVVEYRSANPQMAANVANAIAEEYIAVQSAAKLQSNDDATGWLAPEIDDLRNRVREAEKKVADYRGARGLLTGQNDSTIAAQQLSEVSSELTRVRSSRAGAEAKSESIRRALAAGQPVDTLPDVVASPMMQRLAERRIQLNAQIADLSTTLLDGHPRIKALRSQLSDIDRQTAAEGRKLLNSLDNEVVAARLREDELNRELLRMKSQAAQAGNEEVELRVLKREATAQRQLLETYLTRYPEAMARTDRNYVPADALIVARADAPGLPYYPMVLPSIAASFVAGLLLLSIFVLLRELFSGLAFVRADGHSVGTVEAFEMSAITAAVQTETVPSSHVEGYERENRNEAEAVRAHDKAHSSRSWKPSFIKQWASPDTHEPVKELSMVKASNLNSVKSIADRLIEGTQKRVVVISPEGDEASAASVRLLRDMADRGKRVILLDMTANGTIGLAMLDGYQRPGITELLIGLKRFNEVIHSDRFSQAHVVPLGNADPVDAMRSVDRLPLILDALETVYDFVVVECGPSSAEQIRVTVEKDAAIIMSVVDPESNAVALAALDLDQGGYEDVMILLDQRATVE